MSPSFIIIGVCSAAMLVSGIFGLFYDPGHPWMDKKRKIGVTVLLIAGAVQMITVIVNHP